MIQLTANTIPVQTLLIQLYAQHPAYLSKWCLSDSKESEFKTLKKNVANAMNRKYFRISKIKIDFIWLHSNTRDEKICTLYVYNKSTHAL